MNMKELEDGKKFYGSIKVSERGQIVIPAEARKDFNIKTGDKLLVFGDMEKGLGIATLSIMQKIMAGAMDLFKVIEDTVKESNDGESETINKEKD